MKKSECCIAFFALLQMQVYQIVGWAKAPREASPLEMNVRSAVPTRRHNTGRRRVGTALHRLHGESGARGPRLCPPYSPAARATTATSSPAGVRSRPKFFVGSDER